MGGWHVSFNVENFSSTAGNHTFAAVKGTESYSLLQTSLKDVWSDINSLLENPRIEICGRSQDLHIIIGEDLKAGLTNSHHECVQ